MQWAYWLSNNEYKVAKLSKFYPNVTKITMQRDDSNIPKLTIRTIHYGRKDRPFKIYHSTNFGNKHSKFFIVFIFIAINSLSIQHINLKTKPLFVIKKVWRLRIIVEHYVDFK